MRKRTSLLCLVVFLSTLVFACNKVPVPNNTPMPPQPTSDNTSNTNHLVTEKIKLFYGSSGNDKIVIEDHEITFSNPSEKYKVALESLFEGPTDKSLQSNIPANTIVYGTIIQNEDIIVDLNSNFIGFSGSMAEIIGVGSIVNTLTQFDNIKRVKILVEGEELIGPSGEPRGFMQEFPLEP